MCIQNILLNVKFTKYFYDKSFETHSVKIERNDYDLWKTLTKTKIFSIYSFYPSFSYGRAEIERLRMPHNKF